MVQVLVVDDDPAIRQLITDVLEIDGHQVRLAADGNAAVSALELLRPDCVVLDVMMPGIDGYGVLRSIRSQYGEQVAVIMLTAAAEPGSARRAWEDGVDYYLAKPFDVGELLELVDRLG
jgi:DNA-binding response OmpR family regulator